MSRLRTYLSLFCILLVLSASPLSLRTAQSAPAANALDPNFVPILVAPGTIQGILPLADGKALVYGSFTSIAGVPRSQIAILNSDGSVDPSFKLASELAENNSGLMIKAAALVSGGKILVGGSLQWFATDRLRHYLFRLHPDGSLDPSFDAAGFIFAGGTLYGLNGMVTALAVDASQRILVGGDFTAPHNAITRLNADGSPDASFNPGSGANATVRQIALQSGGQVILAGDFTTFNGVATRGVARLGANGAFDAGYFGAGVSGYSPGGLAPAASAIFVDTDDSVLVGGTFAYLKGQLAPLLARIGSNGVVNTAFAPFVRGHLEEITSLLVVNGVLIAGGWSPVMYFNGKPTDHDAAIYLMNNTSGAFSNYADFKGKPTDVWALAKRSDGKVLAGGSFIQSDWNDLYYPGLILFAPATLGIDPGFKPVVGGQPDLTSVAAQTDGKIIAAGDFYRVDGILARGLARLATNGGLDAGFVPGGTLTRRMTLRADNKIVGSGAYAGAYPDNSDLAIFAQNGTIETKGSAGLASNLITQPDLKVITTQIHSPGVTRFNANLTPDAAFNANLGSGISDFQGPDWEFDRVNTAALQGDKIIAGGSFSTFSGASVHNLVRLSSNGVPDGSFISLPFTVFNFRSEVFALAVQPDNKIVVGGRFSTVGGAPSPSLVRLNPDGSLDTGFHSPFGDSGATVYSLALQPDGKILVGGSMQIVEGNQIYNSLVRLNRDGSRDTTFNANVRGKVKALSFVAPGAVLLAGDFDRVDGQPRLGLARYIVALQTPTLTSNFDSGAPGSFFTLHAANFLPNEVLTVYLNGHSLGNVTADGSGTATFILNTTGADPGPYFCAVGTPALPGVGPVKIQLTLGAPIRAKDGSALVILVPAGIAGKMIHLPLVRK